MSFQSLSMILPFDKLICNLWIKITLRENLQSFRLKMFSLKEFVALILLNTFLVKTKNNNYMYI